MEHRQQERSGSTDIDGFAWASVIIGSISLFYADRLIYPHPRNYFLLSLVLPAAGIATALVADRRVRQNPRARGRELAIAGAVISGVSAIVLVVTKIFVN